MPVPLLAIIVKMSGGFLPPDSRAGDIEIYDNGKILIYESDTNAVERSIKRDTVVDLLKFSRDQGFFDLENVLHDNASAQNIPDVTISLNDNMGQKTVTMTSYQKLKGEMRQGSFDKVYKRINDVVWESYLTEPETTETVPEVKTAPTTAEPEKPTVPNYTPFNDTSLPSLDDLMADRQSYSQNSQQNVTSQSAKTQEPQTQAKPIPQPPEPIKEVAPKPQVFQEKPPEPQHMINQNPAPVKNNAPKLDKPMNFTLSDLMGTKSSEPQVKQANANANANANNDQIPNQRQNQMNKPQVNNTPKKQEQTQEKVNENDQPNHQMQKNPNKQQEPQKGQKYPDQKYEGNLNRQNDKQKNELHNRDNNMQNNQQIKQEQNKDVMPNNKNDNAHQQNQSLNHLSQPKPNNNKDEVAYWTKTQELIEKLEATFSNKLVVLDIGSELLKTEDTRYLYSHLKKIGKKKTLYIIPVIGNSSASAIWRSMTLLRQHCDDLVVVIPDFSSPFSSLLALGANKVLLSPFGYLSPIEIDFKHPMLESQFGTSSVSVHDVLQAQVEVKKGNKTENVDLPINPLVYSAALRELSHNELVTENLLILGNSKRTEEQNKKIAESLTGGEYQKDYPLTINELKAMGLNVDEMSEEQNEYVWEMMKYYRELLNNQYAMIFETTGRRTVQTKSHVWNEISQKLDISKDGKESNSIITKNLDAL